MNREPNRSRPTRARRAPESFSNYNQRPPQRNPKSPSPKRKKKSPIFAIILFLIIVALIVAIISVSADIIGLISSDSPEKPNDEIVITNEGSGDTADTQTTTQPTVASPTAVATATVGNSGDILIHLPVLRSAKSGDGYNFDYMFETFKPYVEKVDYSAINVELSIATSGFETQEMVFRIPSTIIDSVAGCGFDMGLLANNHIWNNGTAGYGLTMDALDKNEMDYIGLRRNSSDKRYHIADVNGIKIGMVNYVYGEVTNASSTLNRFSTDNLPAFYSDMEQQISDMKADGAEAIVLYIHWGVEYQITPNNSQKEIAKKMNELGVDVIIGGHPHKIQPVELLTNDEGHRTVCLYSMGNIISNQTIEAMYGGKASISRNFQDGGDCDIPDVTDRYSDTKWDQHTKNCNDNGHTEDGLLFNYTFTKYDNGTVLLSNVGVLPTWSYRYADSSKNKGYAYRIIPLDKEVSDWGSAFDIKSRDVTYAERSYNRTMEILSSGIEESNKALEADYKAYEESYKNK